MCFADAVMTVQNVFASMLLVSGRERHQIHRQNHSQQVY